MLSLKSLRSMAIGLCALFSFSAIASDFTCPVPTQFQNIACDGSIEVKNLTELLNYKNNLGIKKNKAKNLLIDFNLNSTALTLSTPCKISFAEKRSVKINGDLCLHGGLGIIFGEKNTLIADNIELESNQKIVINERSSVEALNLTITAFDRLSLGSQSLYNITEDIRLYTKGDDNAVVNEGVKINAGLFELQTYEKARIAENVKIKADTVIINGKTCAISHQTTSIIASEKLGSCFLQSSGKGLFSVDKHTGFAPLTVNFDASKIESDSFVWSFGNGVTLTSSTPKITYTYPLPGNFTATLKYKEKDHEHHNNKKFKTAGSIQITVKESANPPPVASLSCTTNNLLVNCNALGSYDPSGSALSFTFDYADGFVESNTSGISSHAYASAGLYLVKLTVSNLAGMTSEATAFVQPVLPPNILPNLVLNCATPTNLKPNTLECDSIGSTDADGTIVSSQYLFDDGAVVTSSSFNKVTHSFFNGGSHTVKLTAVDNDGGVASIEKSILVIDNANPVANFNCTSDKPYQIKCQSNSTDPNSPNDEIVQYSWSLNNEVFTSLTSNLLDYNFHIAGEFPVTLTVKDSYGATNSISKNIEVKDNNPPSVELFASTISGSVPLDVSFEARNAFDIDGSIVKTEWSFPDGTTIVGANTTRQFTEVGETIVTLKVTDDLGAVTTKNIIIEALEPLKTKPIAFFKYSQNGTYLTLSAQLTKTQFEIKKAYYTIDNNPSTTARINLSEFYFNTIKTADLKTLGVHTVTLTVEDIRGQTDSYTHTVDIKEDPTKILPFLDFTLTQSSPLTVFLDLSKSFNSAPGENEDIAFFQIDYGNGTYEEIKNTDLTIRSFSTHTYAAAGTYTVTVSMGTLQGTKAILSKEITITTEDVPVVNPIANFQYQIYNFAQNVNFYNERSGSPNGGIISYFWEFGDGETGTGARVAHFYNPGSYLAKLTVTDFAGLTSTQVQRVVVSGVGDNIASSITCSRDHARANCLMIALDQLSQINYLKLNWGDTNEDFPFLYIPGQGVYLGTHEFTSNGTFNIKFTVGTERGETKVVETSFTTNTLVADIGCTTYNLMVYCSAGGSYDPSGSSLSYKFEYGDDTIDENNSGFSNHAYAQSGLNTVKLTVTNQFGQEATATTQVMPLQGPNIIPLAKFNCGSPTPYTLYCWDDGSGDADGTLVVKKLEFDDDTTDFLMNGAPTRHQFATAGNHTVKLSVVDNDGGTNEMTKSFIIAENNNPVASFECVTTGPQHIGCYSTSTDPDAGDNIISSDWELGDGTTQTGLIGNFDHVYANSSTYTIKLTVHDQFGGSSTATKEFTPMQNHAPIANFECYTPSAQKIVCNSTSFDSDPNDRVVSFDWDFGDGNTQSGLVASFDHDYSTPSIYTIKLTAHDQFGGISTIQKRIQTISYSPPSFELAADITSGEPPLDVKFQTMNPKVTSGTIASYKWIFGDGEEGDQSSLTHTFFNSGIYNVRLQITDTNGGMTEKSIPIFVGYKSQLVINTNVSTGLAPLNVNFDASESTNSNASIVKFEWFLRGSKIGEGSTLTYNFDTIGINTVQLVATDNNGIKTSLSKNIDVTAPELYIEGSFPEKAYVGRKYTASFSEQYSSSIISENLSYELINAPSGVLIDLAKKQIVWTPELQDKGNVSFSLEVKDGQHSFQKRIKLSVFELEKVANANSSGNDGTITVNLGSNLGNAYINYPANEAPYTLEVYKVKDVDWGELVADTSIPIKNPLHIYFEKQVNVETSINEVELAGSGVSTYPEPSTINIRMGDMVACANSLQDFKMKNMISDDAFTKEFAPITLNHSNEIYTKSGVVRSDLRFQRVYNILKNMDLDVYNTIFYFLNELPVINGNKSYAFVPIMSTNSVYLDLIALDTLTDSQIKFILFHETFHITQHQVVGCMTKYPLEDDNWSYKNLIESSAEYYAFKKLNALEQKEVIDFRYGQFKSQENPYEIGRKIFNNGFLKEKIDYDLRLLWEFSPVNMYTFFDNFGRDYRTPPFVLKTDTDVIRILKDSANLGYTSALGASSLGDGIANLSHYLNNYYRLDFTVPNFPGNPSLPIISNIYNPTQYRWSNRLNNAQNKGCNNTLNVVDTVDCDNSVIDISGASKGHAKSFTLNIPSMSARSVKFSGFNNSSIPSIPGSVEDKEFSSQMSAMLKITYTNPDGNISSKVISVVEANNGSINPLRQFNLSVKDPENGKEVLIGTRGFRYNGLMRPMNWPTWSGFNKLGLDNYQTTGLIPNVQGTNFTNFLWEDGMPVTENIMMDFANTSDHLENVVVTVEPLCERKSVSSINGQRLNLNFMCEGSCLDQKTINICWRGTIYEGSHQGDHCMFGNTPPMNTYDNLMRYKDTIYPLTNTTEFYVCGEDPDEQRLIDVKLSP